MRQLQAGRPALLCGLSAAVRVLREIGARGGGLCAYVRCRSPESERESVSELMHRVVA
jgi:hypothetical protein